jgi:hypothetical protein
MEQLIQALTAYTGTLEQQLAALEARVAKMEDAYEAMEREGEEASVLIASLQAEIEALKTTGVVSSEESAEPEIEIELLMDEELNEIEEDTIEELAALEEEVEAQEMPEILVSPLVLEEELAPVQEEGLEVIVEESQPEPVIEPEKKVESAPRTAPAQTSLFGSPVADVRQAISLGDRFLFQRELFAGNGELMQKTLAEINGLVDMDEALDYIRENFDWDMESTAVKLFENVLKRRFA